MGEFYYPDEFFYESQMLPEAMGAGVVGVIAIIYLMVLLLTAVWSVAVYVLQSLSLYTIAGRRGIRNPWLAWIPLGNLWIMGSISDQYRYVTKGEIKNRRKLLLGLSIGLVAVYVGWVFSMIMSIILSEGVGVGAAAAVACAVLGALALSALAIVLTVFQYITYYDLFKSCDSNNAVLYLVLSIIFPVTLPFFVFACRKKDLGMPPRKQPAPQQVVVPTVEVVVDPNVVEQVVVPTVEPVMEEGFAGPEEFEEE